MSWRDREPFDYRRWDYVRREHHRRYAAYVEVHGFTCQDCGGAGGDIDVVIPETGQGPWEPCGWCEGTGYVTRWIRGYWLRWKAEEKRKQAHKKQERSHAA